jgi:arginine deiminase
MSYGKGNNLPWNVTCDVDPLKVALVNAPGTEWELSIPWNEEHPSISKDIIDLEKARSEHKSFQLSLKENSDVMLFELEKALQDSLNELSDQELRKLFTSFLSSEDAKAKLSLEVFSARFILGREASFFFSRDERGVLSPIVLPKKWAIFTRDMAAMTPKGLVICKSSNYERSQESFIAKTIFNYHPVLSKHTQIVLDMSIHKGARLEGGDLLVRDNGTLIVGIGNLSNEHAAEILAKELDLLVLGVTMPRWSGTWNMLNYQFLHLDTLFAMLREQEFLVFPYLFQRNSKELINVFRGLIGDMRARGLRCSKGFQEIPARLKHLGRVTEFRPDGKIKKTEKKLLEYLETPSQNITYVGGDREYYQNNLEHAFEALRQTRFQAANVLAKKPGTLIAYARNKRTLESLKDRYDVKALEADELVRCNGGPHCLAMPLMRS